MENWKHNEKTKDGFKEIKKIKGGDGAWIIQSDWMSYRENIKMGKFAEMVLFLH